MFAGNNHGSWVEIQAELSAQHSTVVRNDSWATFNTDHEQVLPSCASTHLTETIVFASPPDYILWVDTEGKQNKLKMMTDLESLLNIKHFQGKEPEANWKGFQFLHLLYIFTMTTP